VKCEVSNLYLSCFVSVFYLLSGFTIFLDMLERLFCLCIISAFLYFFLNKSPIRLKSGAAFQHVLTSQDPDIPWHLHWTALLRRTSWVS